MVVVVEVLVIVMVVFTMPQFVNRPQSQADCVEATPWCSRSGNPPRPLSRRYP